MEGKHARPAGGVENTRPAASNANPDVHSTADSENGISILKSNNGKAKPAKSAKAMLRIKKVSGI
jgi:hypothetical protein